VFFTNKFELSRQLLFSLIFNRLNNWTKLRMQPHVNVLQEIQVKVNESGRGKKERNDWQLLAMVVDRLCFCIFTAFFGVATVVVFRRQLLPSLIANNADDSVIWYWHLLESRYFATVQCHFYNLCMLFTLKLERKWYHQILRTYRWHKGINKAISFLPHVSNWATYIFATSLVSVDRFWAVTTRNDQRTWPYLPFGIKATTSPSLRCSTTGRPTWQINSALNTVHFDTKVRSIWTSQSHSASHVRSLWVSSHDVMSDLCMNAGWKSFTPVDNSHVGNVLVKIAPDPVMRQRS